jgi:hypothetical protein
LCVCVFVSLFVRLCVCLFACGSSRSLRSPLEPNPICRPAGPSGGAFPPHTHARADSRAGAHKQTNKRRGASPARCWALAARPPVAATAADKSRFVDWQRVRVQENATEIPAGRLRSSTRVPAAVSVGQSRARALAGGATAGADGEEGAAAGDARGPCGVVGSGAPRCTLGSTVEYGVYVLVRIAAYMSRLHIGDIYGYISAIYTAIYRRYIRLYIGDVTALYIGRISATCLNRLHIRFIVAQGRCRGRWT